MLAFAAKHGKACLVLGLMAGLALPELAAWLRPWLPQMIALLLFLTAFRIGPREAVQSLGALRRTAGLLLVLQLALPMGFVALLSVLNVAWSPLIMAVVLVLSASSVTGTPNFTILLGHDPAPAMRLLILGTAILPLTVLPVFWLLPELGDVAAVMQAALRLVAVILGAVGVAFALRYWRWPSMRHDTSTALDGATAIALAVIVVALMSAIRPALASDPLRLLGWLGAAFAVNFGMQLAAYLAMRATGNHHDAVPVAIVAGNRNIALFLVALPPEITAPLLVFIGCYQFPMYLTPIMLGRLYGPAIPH